MAAIIDPATPKKQAKYKGSVQSNLITNIIRGGELGSRLKCEGLSLNAPTEHLRWQLPILRARSRNIISNNPLATSAAEKWVSNLIGKGIRPVWNTDQPELNVFLNNLWAESAHEFDADGLLDIYGIQALVAREMFESGEVLTRFRTRRLSDGLNVPLQVQMIEADYLPETLSRAPNGSGADVRCGIEFNSIGQRRGYWLHKSHPLESFGNTTGDYQLIPAKNILHTYEVKRAGQLRGIPKLAGVLLKLYDLDSYDEAELIRKKTAALFAGFVTKQESLTDEECEREADFQDMEAGTIHYLDEGEDIKFTTPPSDSSYTDYVKTQQRDISVGAGVTYEQLTGDLSNVNYSSLRAGLLEFRRNIEMHQQAFVHQWLRPVVKRWLETAALAGKIDFRDYTANPAKYLKINFVAPRFEQIDPTKETSSDVSEVRAGFTSRGEIVARRGRTVEELDREIRAERGIPEGESLVFDSDPNMTGSNGQLQPTGNDEAQQGEIENDEEKPE